MIYKIETDDSQEFELMFRGADCYFALGEMNEYLRSELKYHSDKYSGEQQKTLEEIRDKLYEIMQYRKLNFDMVQ